MNILGEYNTLFRNKISKLPKASLVVIGNEILSGRTNDKNINFIAKRCDKIGINLNEVRVIDSFGNELSVFQVGLNPGDFAYWSK